ncbi:MAG: sigma-54 dependent transcriptional regulator [Myxococcota bacterium]|nr:sigma-54 dependent transcriptional regulator [Myxococcota bacterium]
MNRRSEILIVTAERSLSESLEHSLRSEDYVVTVLATAGEAVLCLENVDLDLVIVDIPMPDGAERELFRAASVLEIPWLAMVPDSRSRSIESAIRDGARACVAKPIVEEALRLAVKKALEKEFSSAQGFLSGAQRSLGREAGCLIGESQVMQPVFDLIGRVASTRTNVLISGESGTGKELVAQAIHDQSARARGPFIAVNCGAIPENLLESELFGHLKGAFTGASRAKEGLFSVASGGTLFLDEVAELPLALQVKLLRVIQDRQLRPVGGTEDEPLDVRLISATNRALQTEVEEGRFRKDLYYRINVVEVEVPSLRDRREDIPLLLGHFMREFAPKMGREVHSISDAAMRKLMRYDYPGNVRELENLMERAIALARTDEIDLDVLPEAVKGNVIPAQISLAADDSADLETLLRDYEYALLAEALRQNHGVKTQAARSLGISFRSFRYRWQKLAQDAGLED